MHSLIMNAIVGQTTIQGISLSCQVAFRQDSNHILTDAILLWLAKPILYVHAHPLLLLTRVYSTAAQAGKLAVRDKRLLFRPQIDEHPPRAPEAALKYRSRSRRLGRLGCSGLDSDVRFPKFRVVIPRMIERDTTGPSGAPN